MSEFADLRYDVVDRVAWIRLNRPAVRNAFTLPMIAAWAECLEEAFADDGVGAIVVTGSGDSFCAGVDLAVLGDEALRGSALAWKSLLWDHVHRIAFALERIDKPVIACLGGDAVGAGLDMALMCDLRFAARSARLSAGYIRVGAVPGDGGCYFLPKLVGEAKALELLMTGDFVDADEAWRIGLVNQVHERTVLDERTQAFATRLAGQSPVALRLIKRAVRQSRWGDLRSNLDLISSHMGIVQTTEDSAEALRAFRERRPPVFRGR